MIRAYAYLRVSGKIQVEGDGFPRQIAAIENYAQTHGLEIVQVFREEGISGKTELDNRPALQELIRALMSDGVRTVIIERLDRLARDLMIQESIIGDLQRNNFTLISTCEPDLLSNDPTRKLMRQIIGAIAEYDRAMLVAKLRAAKDRKRATTGRCEGQKPYGHYPGESDVIERLLSLRRGGLSYEAIAKKMNHAGVRPRSGVKWHPNAVNRILARTHMAISDTSNGLANEKTDLESGNEGER